MGFSARLLDRNFEDQVICVLCKEVLEDVIALACCSEHCCRKCFEDRKTAGDRCAEECGVLVENLIEDRPKKQELSELGAFQCTKCFLKLGWQFWNDKIGISGSAPAKFSIGRNSVGKDVKFYRKNLKIGESVKLGTRQNRHNRGTCKIGESVKLGNRQNRHSRGTCKIGELAKSRNRRNWGIGKPGKRQIEAVDKINSGKIGGGSGIGRGSLDNFLSGRE